MNSWFDAQMGKYGAIVAGWIIGTAAKHGLALSEGRTPSLRALAADVLLIGMVVLLSRELVDRLALTGNGAVLAGALFAISSDRTIRLARTAFDRWIEAKVARATGDVRNAVQADMSAERVATDPRTAPIARLAERPLPPTRDDDALLNRLDEPSGTEKRP